MSIQKACETIFYSNHNFMPRIYQLSGWPSGLRRQTQGWPSLQNCGGVSVLVHECGRGFESHFWQNFSTVFLGFAITLCRSLTLLFVWIWSYRNPLLHYVNIIVHWLKSCLPDGESNPGLPRDRRGYLPLYYRGLTKVWELKLNLILGKVFEWVTESYIIDFCFKHSFYFLLLAGLRG